MTQLAVLFDAENISHNRVGVILDKIKQLGNIMVLRAYGDFTNIHYVNWTKWNNVINLIQVDDPYNCKNRTDQVLAIAAMDLLYDDSIDEFCIVSSDSDFTPLIERILKSKKVHVFGEINSIEIYRSSTSTFTNIGSLYFESNLDELIDLLKQVVTVSYRPLTQIGHDIYQIDPQFDPKKYRCKNLTEIFKLLDDTFEIFILNDIVNVRCKRVLNVESPVFIPSNR